MKGEESLLTIKNTEMKGRIIGAQSVTKTFSFLFGCILGEKILLQTDNLSRTLQSPKLSAVEAHQLSNAVVNKKKLEKERSDDKEFSKFWVFVNKKKEELGIDDPQLPRKRKHPERLTENFGNAQDLTEYFGMHKQTNTQFLSPHDQYSELKF